MRHPGTHTTRLNILARGILICLLLSTGLAAVRSQPSVAQTPSPDPTILSLGQLGIKEQTLRGPFDAAYLEFGLPENWQIDAPGELQLDIDTLLLGNNVDPNLNASSELTPTTSGARSTGLLSIKINDVSVGNLPLGGYGPQTLSVSIPISAFVSARSDGIQFIYIELTDYPRCDKDEQVVLFLRTTSHLRVAHSVIPLQPNIRRLPRPFYQRSIQPDIAALVVPDQPSADELQAALNVAAGFGRMTAGNLGLTLTTPSLLQRAGPVTSNLILVGKAGTFTGLLGKQFNKVAWPIPPHEQGFDNADIAPDDGVLQMVSSPWDDSRALLWVGSETDAGLLKAARALSSGSVRALTTPNVAVVSGTRPPTDTAELSTDFDLSDLGYDSQEFAGPGVRYSNFQFYVPENVRAKSDAYFEVNYLHSALLNYASSGLIVTLNGEYIGSARFSDSSTQLSKERIALPANSIRTGKNDLGVQVDLAPRNQCGNSLRLWAALRRESRVHLPLAPLPAGGDGARPNLSRYPKPFNTQPDLSHLAFVVAPGDVAGWQAAARLAFQLGQNSAQQPLDIVLLYGDSADEQRRNERNLIIVGRPTLLPLLEMLTDVLPAPFAPGSDVATQPAEVEYRVPNDADVGYVQVLASPWNEGRVIMTVLGNSEAGLQQAVNALTLPKLRSQLTGNLAVLNNDQVYAEDIRTKTRQAIATPTAAPNPAESADNKPGTPAWLLPTIAISVGSLFILISLLGFAWAYRQRTRKRKHNPERRQKVYALPPPKRRTIARDTQPKIDDDEREADERDDYAEFEEDEDEDEDEKYMRDDVDINIDIDEQDKENNNDEEYPNSKPPPSAPPAKRIARQVQRPIRWHKDN